MGKEGKPISPEKLADIERASARVKSYLYDVGNLKEGGLDVKADYPPPPMQATNVREFLDAMEANGEVNTDTGKSIVSVVIRELDPEMAEQEGLPMASRFDLPDDVRHHVAALIDKELAKRAKVIKPRPPYVDPDQKLRNEELSENALNREDYDRYARDIVSKFGLDAFASSENFLEAIDKIVRDKDKIVRQEKNGGIKRQAAAILAGKIRRVLEGEMNLAVLPEGVRVVVEGFMDKGGYEDTPGQPLKPFRPHERGGIKA
ncbi:MAG TPA: hypothetical protein VJG48_02020 [Candidatus Paceibacterota bacterium]